MAGASVSQGWRIAKRGFRGVYDFAGTSIILSTIWFFLGLFPVWLTFLVFTTLPTFFTLLVPAVLTVFLLGPLTAGVYSVIDQLLQGEEIGFKQYLPHFTRHYKRAARATAVMVALLGVLVVDLIFFLQMGTLWSQIISVAWMYLLLFWLMMAMHVVPLLVRKEPPLLANLKMAALLALDNIVATLIIALFTVLVAAVAYFLRAPLMLFMAGTFAFLHCAAMDELLGKYGRRGQAAPGDTEAADEK